MTLGHLRHPGMGVPGVCAWVVGIVQEPRGILVPKNPSGTALRVLPIPSPDVCCGASASALHLVLPARKAIRAGKITVNLILNYQAAASQTLL